MICEGEHSDVLDVVDAVKVLVVVVGQLVAVVT